MASSSLFLRLLLLASSLCVGAAFAVGAARGRGAACVAQSLAQRRARRSITHRCTVAAPITMKQKKDALELEGVVLERSRTRTSACSSTTRIR